MVSVYVVASAAFAAAFYLLCLAVPETLDGASPKGMALIEARACSGSRTGCCAVDLRCCEGSLLRAQLAEHARVQAAADLHRHWKTSPACRFFVRRMFVCPPASAGHYLGTHVTLPTGGCVRGGLFAGGQVCLWYSAVNLVTTGYGALVRSLPQLMPFC